MNSRETCYNSNWTTVYLSIFIGNKILRFEKRKKLNEPKPKALPMKRKTNGL